MSHSILPHFEPDLEHKFQQRYYLNVRRTLRTVPFILVLLFLLYAVRTYLDKLPLFFVVGQNGPPILLCLLIFGLTFVNGFERIWQPAIVALSWIAMGITLDVQASHMAEMAQHPRPGGNFNPVAVFGLQLPILLVSLATFRLRFFWSILLYCGVLGLAMWALVTQIAPAVPNDRNVLWGFLQPSPFILFALVVVSWVQEQLARNAFLANHLLEEERNDERRKREQTEKTLHVLAQAIGGIVHDLGNPLTTVHMGVQTIELFLDSDPGIDRETLKKFIEMINNGTEMLNHLRLSLMEQTRVLEGKPTPVEIKPCALREVIQAGARFQRPHIVGQRSIQIDCQDVQIYADKMKMVTVFMNLIGNALKYSDGEVRVKCREFQDSNDDTAKGLLVAVLDCGTQGKGISQEQARQLFTAFGRLETHIAIEGTGLGLLSVQKIVEAHGGETFIEGYQNGTSVSAPFTTAQDKYPRMLHDNFRTAFVMTCSI